MNLLSIYKTSIRWTDLDAYGHLNNSVFFNFMTEARAELFRNLLNKENFCQFVTVHVECDYKIPCFYPEELILKQYCESVGNSTFALKYEFYSESKKDMLYAQGKAKMVAYDPVAKRPTRIPKEIIQLLKVEEAEIEAKN